MSELEYQTRSMTLDEHSLTNFLHSHGIRRDSRSWADYETAKAEVVTWPLIPAEYVRVMTFITAYIGV